MYRTGAEASYPDRVTPINAGPSSSPSPSNTPSTSLAGLDFSDGVGWLAFGLALLIAVVSIVVWVVRVRRKRKEEASLVTSHYRLLGGTGAQLVYEISVHNATPHPLRIVEVMYWDGDEWRPMLARSTASGDPVLLPGDVGVATVPAMTTDLDEFDHFYYYSYTDSRNRIWARKLDSPDFLSRGDLRQLRAFHGTL